MNQAALLAVAAQKTVIIEKKMILQRKMVLLINLINQKQTTQSLYYKIKRKVNHQQVIVTIVLVTAVKNQEMQLKNKKNEKLQEDNKNNLFIVIK